MVLTRFGKDHYDQLAISDFLQTENDVYPVGRLDKDSEGLLILTNDSRLNHLILNPKEKLPKKYWVQVEGDITSAAIKSLQTGVTIKVDNSLYQTAPCSVIKLRQEPELPPRNPPIRFRQLIPTSWIQITLTEGKNRQIRKMCAQVEFPVLRLVRVGIGKASLSGLLPGKARKYTRKEIAQLLELPDSFLSDQPVIKKKSPGKPTPLPSGRGIKTGVKQKRRR